MTEDGGRVGLFDFGREGRKTEVFCGGRREKQNKIERVERGKMQAWLEKRRKAGKGEKKRQVFFTVLRCIDLCLFMILHYSQD